MKDKEELDAVIDQLEEEEPDTSCRTFINPVRELRNEFGHSLKEFAKLLRLSPRTLFLTEASCYHHVPKPVLASLEEQELVSSVALLESRYSYFQTYTRQVFGASIGWSAWTVDFLFGISDGKNPAFTVGPFERLRTLAGEALDRRTPSRLEFAFLLAIEPSKLLQLESARLREIPSSILTALEDAFLPDKVISELAELQYEYRQGQPC